MIAYLNGILHTINQDSLVVEVNGVGYEIKITKKVAANLPMIGSEISLFVKQIVREDDISLYGFLSFEERNLFNILLSVSGVGPKAASNILSYLSIEQVISAIAKADVLALSSVHGIGKKTAERMVVDLREKIQKTYDISDEGKIVFGPEFNSSQFEEVIAALVTLGYRKSEAQAAIKKVSSDIDHNDVENLVKSALKVLAK